MSDPTHHDHNQRITIWTDDDGTTIHGVTEPDLTFDRVTITQEMLDSIPEYRDIYDGDSGSGADQ